MGIGFGKPKPPPVSVPSTNLARHVEPWMVGGRYWRKGIHDNRSSCPFRCSASFPIRMQDYGFRDSVRTAASWDATSCSTDPVTDARSWWLHESRTAAVAVGLQPRDPHDRLIL